MSQSLNVIALISGGKDSIYSILHCLQNGHKVVALGNVYPPSRGSSKSREDVLTEIVEADEEELNSYMYQTVGHSTIPLYEQALGIPLYRQPILGKAVESDTTYKKPANGVDETESLVPLLQRIVAAHPEANAVSTGAILSTYQRTRVESVALRLGLQPLAFLWRYPFLPPKSQVSLLMDMDSVGLDARIVRVASMGLDESLLWQNVASKRVMRKLERIMTPFTVEEQGAVLGEGGEFETLVLDGPDHLFKGRIVVDEEDRQVVEGHGGTAWIRINRARVEMKVRDGNENDGCARIPGLFTANFKSAADILNYLTTERYARSSPNRQITQNIDEVWEPLSTKIYLNSMMEGQNWMIAQRMQPNSTIEEEVEQIMAQIKSSLELQNLDVTDVMSSLILLRSMSHFAIVNKVRYPHAAVPYIANEVQRRLHNGFPELKLAMLTAYKVYGGVFIKPNPPARVTVACGDVLPRGHNIIVHLNLVKQRERKHWRRGLHVQSRSYWAPANIGPYSQAISISLSPRADCNTLSLVHVAGQIPLIPSTMALAVTPAKPAIEVNMMADTGPCLRSITHNYSNFTTQTALSLQHLWRIGSAIDVIRWTGAVVYLSRDSPSRVKFKAELAHEAWVHAHDGGCTPEDEEKPSEAVDENDRDLWEARYNRSFVHAEFEKRLVTPLGDLSVVSGEWWMGPPLFAAEVEELPRGSEIEWHALLGVTAGPVVQKSAFKSNFGKAYRTVVKRQFSQTLVFVTYAPEIQDLGQSVDSLMSELETPDETERRHQSPGYHHAHAAYLVAGVKGLWDAYSYAGAIPCRSLWAPKLNRLAAVLVFQSYLEVGEIPFNDSLCNSCGKMNCKACY